MSPTSPLMVRMFELAARETGGKVSPDSLTTDLIFAWRDRVVRASGVRMAAMTDMPLEEFVVWVEETTPPPGMFGAPLTIGELFRVMEVVGGERETSPTVLEHARNRLAVIKTTADYWRLVEASHRTNGGRD